MFGVCMAALGYEMYGSSALNLAMSLKLSDPEIKIALLCDDKSISHLSEKELGLFDYKIFIKEDYKNQGYQIIKLLINKYTPFKYTMYMDVDSIWLDKKVSWLFGELINKNFHIGLAGNYKDKRPNNNYTFWGDPKVIMDYHKLTCLLQSVSGFYYFKKNEETDKIFELALYVYNDKNAPAVPWGNGKADEYCFNVALSSLGHIQKEFSVFYFDKLDGKFDSVEVYESFWGIAMGGHRVKKDVAEIYNRLVDRNCQALGIEKRHYHKDKADVIKERLKN